MTLAEPFESPWDEEIFREGRRKYRQSRRRLGKPERLAKLRDDLAERQMWECHYCGRRMSPTALRRAGVTVLPESVTLEHLIPHAEGGDTSEENCRAVCHCCNGLKGKLDQATRRMEMSLREGFVHEIHYYAEGLRKALSEWEERISGRS